jgi:hypothetical protein
MLPRGPRIPVARVTIPDDAPHPKAAKIAAIRAANGAQQTPNGAMHGIAKVVNPVTAQPIIGATIGEATMLAAMSSMITPMK